MAYCEICNNKRGVLSIWNTKDGHKICEACMKLVSRGDEQFYTNLYDHCNEITFAEWKKYIQNPLEAQKWNYSDRPIITKIGDVIFEDKKQTISFPGDALGISVKTYQYSQIYKYEYIENHATISSGGSGIGRAIVGGMLFGGAGAIVGAATKKHNYEDAVSNMHIRIVFMQENKTIIEKIQISDWLDGKMLLDSWTYERYINNVEKIMLKLDEAYAMSHKEKKNGLLDDSWREQKIDITQQLMQLKSLYDNDLISEEEYAEQKKKLLNSYDFSLEKIQIDSHNNDGIKLVEKVSPKKKIYQLGDIELELSDKNILSDKNAKIWSHLCAYLAEPKNTIQQYTDAMNILAYKTNCIATNKNNLELYNMALNRIQNNMSHDETPIYYADEGLISYKAKAGCFVTNKHLFLLRKNNLITLNLNQIFSIHAPKIGETWYLNDEVDYSISSVPWNGAIPYALNLAFIIQLYAESVGKKTHLIMKGN